MSTVRLRLGDVQASAVEIGITDPAHDDEREVWWPRLDGSVLVFELGSGALVAGLLTDAANSEDDAAEHCPDAEARRDARRARDGLTTIAARVRALGGQ